MPGILLVIVFMIFGSSACKTKQTMQAEQNIQQDSMPYVIKFERGPCYGTCPVYSFYVLKDHTGLVNAKANLMPSPGWYAADLDDESLAEILELIEPGEWWSPDLRDQPEIADLPSSSLIYQHTTGIRTIDVQSRMNESLHIVFSKLNHLVTESQWKPTDARPLELPKPTLTDVIVQLKPGIDIHTWMQKYDRFGITLKKKIAPNQSYFLVAKDPMKGDANDFLQYIKLDPDVVDAQWDKAMERRDK